MEGNVQKMREALENSNGLLEELAAIGEWGDSAREQIAENNTALSASPRNCDVGTAEEQAERFGKLCIKYYNEDEPCNRKCPLMSLDFIKGFPRCQAYWTQMPYEKGGTK